MFKQQETWTVNRHISPEPQLSKVDKLNYMQENLSLAANTINALKLERDKLKGSLRTTLEENKYSENFQESELSGLDGRCIQRETIKKQALK